MRLIPRSSALLRSAGKATNQRPAVIPSFQCSPGLLCKAPFSSTTVRGRADVEVDEGLPKDASENHHALSNAMKRLNRTVGDSAVKGIDKGGDMMHRLNTRKDEAERVMKDAGQRIRLSAEHMEEELEKSKQDELDQAEKERR